MYFDQTVTLSEMDYLDVKNLAQTGEGTFLEFKRTVPDAEKIAREMAAFANTRGGILLIGIDDDKSLVGVESYQEEEFLLKEAATVVCRPKINIIIEIVHFGKRDLLVINIPEAAEKPVYVQGKKGDMVYIRRDEHNEAISEERIQILKNRHSNKGVTFRYGANEQRLFRYLNEYGEISVTKFAQIIDKNRLEAGKTLVNLVSAGILNLFTKDNIDYFTFSRSCESPKS